MVNTQQLTDPGISLVFFEQAYKAYRKTENTVKNPVDYFYRIAGFVIRLCFAQQELMPYITPALSHLTTEPVSNPDLTVYLWHTLEPPIPCEANGNVKTEEQQEIDQRIHTILQKNQRIFTIVRTEVDSINLSMLDKARNIALHWVRIPAMIPHWDIAAPLRDILHAWMKTQSVQLVHGAAVGLPDGGVLIAGKSGSGKSTTALSCLQSELFYVSDDYCLLGSDLVPTVYSIYSAGKKNSDDLQRLPFLLEAISNSSRIHKEKALYLLHKHFPERLLPSVPLRAVLIPRITEQKETTFSPATCAQGLITIAPSTLFQLPLADEQDFSAIASIIRKVPCYYLNLGTDMEQIPQVILNFLAQQSHP